MIQVKSISFSYDPGRPSILDDISFDVEKGHCLAILGNNGAGKSTLLKCLNRIQDPDHGSVVADGEDLLKISRREMAKRIAYVPQHSARSNIMVFDAVLLGRKPYIRWDATDEDRKIVSDLLAQLDLQKYSDRSIDQLSGGELQKVVLARALAQQPQYLLLDEPTSSLDPKNQHEMLKLVKNISQEKNIGVVIVIHDLSLAARYCDRFLFLRDSKVYAHGGLEVLTSENIREVYGMEVEILEHKGNKVIVAV